MNDNKRVAVTGATGFVGRAVVRELLERGYTVRALVRDTAKADEVLPRDPRLERVIGDILDPRAADELMHGLADAACIHLIGIIRETPGGRTFKKLHTDATASALRACKKAGVTRFIRMSALGVGPEGKAPYQKTNYAAEQLIRRSGLDWTIFRASLIHGQHGEFVRMAAELVRGDIPPYFFLPYFARPETDTRVPLGGDRLVAPLIQPVYVTDAAWYVAEALSRPETVGEIFNLVGSEVLNWPDMLVQFRDSIPHAKTSLLTHGLPGRECAWAAKAASMVGLGGLLPFDEGQALMGMEDAVADASKLAAFFDRTPRGFRETLAEYAARV